jgi:hypothetical protein
MEGWYRNEDGSYSISFGYLNANADTLYIPVGPDNFIEPARFNGMQPTIFFPRHERGIFTVELPAEMRETDVWWTLRKPNGDVSRVPGRVTSNAYELDWIPRPHGSLHPLVSFESQDEEGRGPPGLLAEQTLSASAGSPITLSISARDPSARDQSDFRFAKPLPLRVTWTQIQGPGRVEYSLPEADSADAEENRANARVRGSRRRPHTIRLTEGHGTAFVIATFTEPGEYLMRARVDNFNRSDSSDGDQCCWTNGYIRVDVTP